MMTHDDINYAVAHMQEQDTIAKEVFTRAILRDKKTMKVARLNKKFLQFYMDNKCMYRRKYVSKLYREVMNNG
jgi:alkylated DNA repair dioxygenase AlkB